MTKAPTAEQLTIARRCAAKYWQTGDPSDEAAARSILSGEWDDQAYTQAALAAIIETTEAAAKLANDFAENAHAYGNVSIAHDTFGRSLRNNDHLKGQPHE